ncbi:MAG TPA: DNA cytosine methyltransferase [Pseudobacteroides sp.]|uniref:DNA cytosine methyltransferase n=1 Tax=Pseudobacteroides sp. TaxID=1968840 RepID=UPI002F937FCA
MLTHLSLFSGIGGIDLAAEWAGFETVGQCEWADYPTKVLEKHWPNVSRWRDIRELTMESFFARTNRTTVDLISGGFPCQPHSVIGKRLAEKDERHLWPEMLRVIRELNPTWVIGENVNGILSTIHDSVCSDLENCGFEVRTFNIPAIAVGAHHYRYRVFIVCVAKGKSRSQAYKEGNANRGEGQTRPDIGCSYRQTAPGIDWETYKPGVLGMAYGLSSKLDRYKHNERHKCLGNAVVPQQVYPILRAIADILRGDLWITKHS